jgi:2-C-methyl-D-erythritol 4-phosphate cytidylyltransferase
MACAYFAIIPAAGSGSRFGESAPKQYQQLCGRPVLEHAVRTLARFPAIQTIYVVLAPDDTLFRTCHWDGIEAKVVALYCGGPTRAASVFNALMATHDQIDAADWVLVHDAARPCVSRGEVERLLSEVADDDAGGLLALPLTDTLKRGDALSKVEATVPRTGLWRALTPQMFRYRLLVEAMHAANRMLVTDESAAIERLGLRPRLVTGSASNIKVTYPQDLLFARAILESRGDAA